MGKSVAVPGDVQAQPAGDFALTGTILLKTDPKLSVGGKPVVLSASALFTSSSSGATETVALTGGGKLQGAAGGVLLNGDSKTGSVSGCTLSVSASGKLQVG